VLKINHIYHIVKKQIHCLDQDSVDYSKMSKLTIIQKNRAEYGTENQQEMLIAQLRKGFSDCLLEMNVDGDVACYQIYASYSEIEKWQEMSKGHFSNDFIVWPELVTASPKLLVFDMDSTFIEIEVIDELARRHGVGDKVAKVTDAAMRGEIDFSESLISRVACIQGLPESTIDEISLSLPISQGVEQLVKQCHINGIKVAIVSGGFTPFVSHLKKSLNLFRVKANNLEVEAGELTGRVLGSIVDAKSKADFVVELQTELGLDASEIMTIGDGANDLVMMKKSGFSLAYRAKPKVQMEAKGVLNSNYLNDLATVFGWSD
jgi:phosphoserine phosphatase